MHDVDEATVLFSKESPGFGRADHSAAAGVAINTPTEQQQQQQQQQDQRQGVGGDRLFSKAFIFISKV